MNKDTISRIDELITKLSESDTPPSQEVLDLIDGIETEIQLSKEKKLDSTNDLLFEKLDSVVKAVEGQKGVDLLPIISAIQKLKIETPVVNVPQPKVTVLPPKIEIPPIEVPETILPPFNIPPVNLRGLEELFKRFVEVYKPMQWPWKAKEAIPVKLIYKGEEYMAFGGGGSIVGGGASTNVDISEEAFDHGRNSDVDTGREQLTSRSVPAKKGVVVKAANGNSGKIYVGKDHMTSDTNDDTDGFELGAGESITVYVDNANKIHVAASVNNQVVYWFVT